MVPMVAYRHQQPELVRSAPRLAYDVRRGSTPRRDGRGRAPVDVDHFGATAESPRRPPPRFFGKRRETLPPQNFAGDFVVIGRDEHVYIRHGSASGAGIGRKRHVYSFYREGRNAGSRQLFPDLLEQFPPQQVSSEDFGPPRAEQFREIVDRG